MAGWTNKGKMSILEAYFRNAGAPTNFYIILFTDASAPDADTDQESDLTEIAAGNGYTTGGYSLDKNDFYKATRYTNRWCLNKAWHKQIRPFKWLIDHFAPVPEWESKAKWNDDGSLLFDGELNL